MRLAGERIEDRGKIGHDDDRIRDVQGEGVGIILAGKYDAVFDLFQGSVVDVLFLAAAKVENKYSGI